MNSVSSNGIGILALGATGNRIYLNSFDLNTGYNALSWASANQWSSTMPITYFVDGVLHESLLGNYFGDHDLTDADGDAIADRQYQIPRDGSPDGNPLVQPTSQYDFVYPGEY